MIRSYQEKVATFYIIPTPIGNLEDITLRALATLKKVDLLFCEDTRNTALLLSKYEIKKPLLSCHEYNEEKIKEKVFTYLQEGKTIGLVTDQGTPIISDPGYKLASYLIQNGYPVVSLPGATAFVPALTSSGLPPQPFLFYGFLNAKPGKMKKELEVLKQYPFTIIFYEAPHRIKEMLETLQEIFGNRKIALGREISKIYETYYYGTIQDVLKEIDTVKGEIVIVVEGCQSAKLYENLSLLEHVNLYLADGLRENEAIKKVAQERNLSKSIVYKEYQEHKKGSVS